jgi:hypothetical protein
LVGGDTAEVSDIKFSNDGKSMLLTTTNNHIYVLDAYGGDKLSHIILPIFFALDTHPYGAHFLMLHPFANIST